MINLINKLIKLLFLLMTDLMAYFTSLSLAFVTRKLIGVIILKEIESTYAFGYLLNFWWMPLIFLFFIWYEKLYTTRSSFWDETKEILKAVSLSVIFIFTILFLSKKSNEISRLTIVFLFLYALLLFPIFRSFGKKILNRFSIGKASVVIIGADSWGISVAKSIFKDIHLGYDIKGFLDDFKKGYVEIKSIKIPILGDLKDLEVLKDVDTIVISIPSLSSLSGDRLFNLINNAYQYSKNIFIVPGLKDVGLLNNRLYYLFDEKIFLIKIKNNLRSKINQAIKRIFDIVLSLLILPFLLILIPIISILIKLDSKGPLFFVQDRLGKDGKLFKCIKFRTMYLNNEEILIQFLKKKEEAYKEWQVFKKLKNNDPRVTNIGKFLRKTSLDELPQIFNVLKGDMSFVGPRPYLPSEEKDMGIYKNYIILPKPGITGLWQISGRNKLTFKDRLSLDIWYVKNWNLWLDIVILIRTIKVVLKGEGAY